VKDLPKDVMQQRISLLVDFNSAAASLLDKAYWCEQVRENSPQSMLMECRSLLLPQLRINFLVDYVKKRATNSWS